jgi:hypothetical protein
VVARSPSLGIDHPSHGLLDALHGGFRDAGFLRYVAHRESIGGESLTLAFWTSAISLMDHVAFPCASAISLASNGLAASQ